MTTLTPEIVLKTCTNCRDEKPLDDFPKDRNRVDGRHPQCKLCRRVAYHEKYREKSIARCKERHAEHRQEDNEKSKAYYDKNIEYFRAYQSSRGRENYSAWYRRNLAVNREASRKAAHLRVWDEAAEDFFEKVLRFDPCSYCGTICPDEMTRDHIVPIACGGDSSLMNLAPACHRCNTSKRRQPLLQFVSRQAHLVKQLAVRQGTALEGV